MNEQRVRLETLAHASRKVLQGGSRESAERVMENLRLFRWLLLSRKQRSFKTWVLACLEGAARQDPAYARVILPILEEAMDFRGKRAIGERVMVSFVRLRREQKKHEAV